MRQTIVLVLALTSVAPGTAGAQPRDAYAIQLGWRCQADRLYGAGQLGLAFSKARFFVGLLQYGVAGSSAKLFIGALQLGTVNYGEVLFGYAQVGAVNLTRRQLAVGLQAGGYNDNTGLAFVVLQLGGVNHTDHFHAGLLQVGLANWYRQGAFYGGIQLAPVNYAEGGGPGFFGLAQVGGFNYFDPDFHGGLQLGLINAVRLRFVGLAQVGGFNGANTFFGLMQLGGFNATLEAHHGLQLGLFNWGREIYGAQLGLVNVTARLRGLQLGLVNLSRDGGLPVSVLVNVGW